MSISRNNTQLTSLFGYNTDRLVFSKPIIGNIPNSKIEFRRINIGTINPDGSIGEFIVETLPNLFSFGISENQDLVTNVVTGHSFSICMWDAAKGATDEQKEWVDTMNAIVDKIKDHLVSVRKEIKKGDLELRDLKKFKAFYLKLDEHREHPIANAVPIMYCKLDEYKKTGKILSVFRDENGQEMDPLTLTKQQCYTRAAIRLESIFIGDKISLQIKLFEANIKQANSLMRNLLSNKDAVSSSSVPEIKININPENNDIRSLLKKEDNIIKKNSTDDEGSISDGEEEKNSPPSNIEKVVTTLSTTSISSSAVTPSVTPTKKVIKRGGK